MGSIGSGNIVTNGGIEAINYSTSALSNMNTSRLESIIRTEDIDVQTRRDIQDILRSRQRNWENEQVAYRNR